MKILITGANGFIGKNLIDRLNQYGDKYQIYKYDIDSKKEDLETYTKDCDFVYNFAAVHRPKNIEEFNQTNHLFFDELLNLLEKNGNKCPVLYTSSIQATNGTPYGNSKIMAEKDLLNYSIKNGTKAIIYRLTNTYGKWAMPNHHSVVATFCYNIARGMPIIINDENLEMNFYYIDDVIDSFVNQLENTVEPDNDGIYRLPENMIHTIKLGDLAKLLQKYNKMLKEKIEPTFANETEKTLYYTYISYLD